MGKSLTRADVLERLKTVWELIDPKRGKLSDELEELIMMNYYFGKLYVSLLDCEDFTEVHAIGFGAGDDEEDEADEEGDEWDE